MVSHFALLAALCTLLLPKSAHGDNGKSKLKWTPFVRLNDTCNGINSNVYKDVFSSGVCEPYMTGPWCSDGWTLKATGSSWCNSTKKRRGKCNAVASGCRYPLMALTTEDNKVLPLLHANRPGPINSCLQSRRSSRPLHFLFVGDSQTLMLEFEFRRWASGGIDEPRFEGIFNMPGSKRAWTSSHVTIEAIVSQCIKKNHSYTMADVFRNLHQAVSVLAADTEVVVVAGFGIWDVVFSACTENETLTYMEPIYTDVLDKIISTLRDAATPRGISVELYVRNMFYSYQTIRIPWGNYLVRLNNLIENSYMEQKRRPQSSLGSVRLHYLDVHDISAARKGEMPYNGDGLHWTCLSRADYQYCHLGLMGARRPDEVAWAAVQLVLLDYCGLYVL